MDKDLAVYPIPAGHKLHVFAITDISRLKILDMEGTIVYDTSGLEGRQHIIDIRELPSATYIVEAFAGQQNAGRSVFVKL